MSDGSPEISVIIPCRGEAIVTRTLDALLALCGSETDAGVEVLVVTSVPLQLDDHPRVSVIPLDQQVWPAVARNTGLSRARGEIVVFLDADCIPQPGWLAQVRATGSDSDVITSGAIVPSGESFEQLCYNLVGFREFLVGHPPSRRRFLPSFCLYGPRRAFVEVGGFDQSLQTAEDLDLTVRLAAAGWRLRYEPAVRVMHCPSIHSVSELMRRGWRHGQNSIKVRRYHPAAFGQKTWTFHALLLALGAPFAALYFCMRTVARVPLRIADAIQVGAVVFAYRVFWCLGAAWTLLHWLDKVEPEGPNIPIEER